MATSLTPTEQLAAAQSQFKNWYNKQIAAGNQVTLGDINNQKAAILNTGAYPALNVGVAQPTHVEGGPLVVNIAPDSFFIEGTGGGYVGDTNVYSGTPVLQNPVGANTAQLIAAQEAAIAAQDAASQAALEQSQTNLANAQATLAAAKARSAALQAEIDANTAALGANDPTVGVAATAASDATNSQLGIVQPTSNIDPVGVARNQANADAALVAQVTKQNEIIAQSNAVAALDPRNTATGSGQGTTFVGAVTPSVSPDTPQNTNNTSPVNEVVSVGGQNSTVTVPVAPTTNGTVEDHANPTTDSFTGSDYGTPTPSIFSDQSPSSLSSDLRPLLQPTGIGPSSTATVTGSGPATNNPSGESIAGNNTSNGGHSSSKPAFNGANVKENKLHDYVNWTYRVSLFAVPRDNINAAYNGTLTPNNVGSVLLKGAYYVCSDGGYGDSEAGASRKFFPTDLSIDNLELETVVANDNRTRGTDVYKMKFDIIEPYTVNFLARLQKLATSLNSEAGFNWALTFFVMKIEFLGYDDLGKPQNIPNTTKYIPFTFTKMKFKVSASGGKYSCDAIPVHSVGTTPLDNTIPFSVEVQGGTIKDLFNGASAQYGTKQGGQNPADRASGIVNTSAQVTDNTTVIKGLADALNKSEIAKTNPKNAGQTKANVYEFEFDPSILNATIANPKKFNQQGASMTAPDNTQSLQAGKAGSLVADFTKGSFKAQNGTKITDFINSIISVSSYMTDQHTPSGHDNQSLNLWKINPVVKFGDIDKATNFYQRTVKYIITPYVMRGSDAVGFGQQVVNNDEIVKQYLYIYSGQNKDILDVNIEYNMAFFEVKNGSSVTKKQTGDKPGDQTDPNVTGFGQADSYDGTGDNRFWKPRYHYVEAILNRSNTSSPTLDDTTIAVQNLMEKLYDNGGDMFKLDITIVGDPDWISQDVPLYGPLIGTSVFVGNSVNYLKPAYFNFYFATPNSDYDDTTGLFNSEQTYSQFSGIFQVAMVTSSFSGGKFTQKLKNYRVRNQKDNPSSPSRSDSAPSQTVNALTRGASENPPAEPATKTVTAPNTSINKYSGPIRNDEFRNRGVGAIDATGGTNIIGARGQGIIEDAGP
jgi:hypothetical protein